LHYAVVDNKVIFTSIQRCTDDIYRDNIGIQSSNLLEVVAMQYKLDK